MPAPSISSRHVDLVATGEDTVVFVPGTYRLGAGTLRPVIWCHGAGQDDDDIFGHRKTTAIVERGFCLIGGDFGGMQTWGNQLSTDRISQTLAYARAEGWCSDDPPVLVTGSMGNTVGLNWVRQNLSDCAGVVAWSGLFDLQSIYNRNAVGATSLIDDAYGGSWDPGTMAAERDPAVYVQNGDLSGVPIITFYGTADTITPPADEAAFAADHIAQGGSITRNEVGPFNHAQVFWETSKHDVADAVEEMVS